MAEIDEGLLDQALAAVERSRNWTPRLVSKLEALVRSADDEALFRVNPIVFASQRNVDESEAIDLFLHAARHGLFHMEWQLICPVCTDLVESFDALGNVTNRYFCHLCSVDLEASLDDFIEIGFTINSKIRPLKYHSPDALSIEDYCLGFHFSRGARVGGRPFR